MVLDHAARAGKDPQDIRHRRELRCCTILKLEAGYHPQYARNNPPPQPRPDRRFHLDRYLAG